MRTGFASDVPRHITAPPQWIGGWPGCICARIAEWIPSAPISNPPVSRISPDLVWSVTVTPPSGLTA